MWNVALRRIDGNEQVAPFAGDVGQRPQSEAEPDIQLIREGRPLASLGASAPHLPDI
jgi:hypothetical protein